MIGSCGFHGVGPETAKLLSVLSKVDDFATFKKVEVHAENSTF